jgi:hypothetical protein
MAGLDPPARLKPLRRGEGSIIHLLLKVDGCAGQAHA